MANFLDDLSVYNAKAALAISQAAADGNTDKANMMSSLKTTANDTTLAEVVRLNALTALINLGGLLDIPLPPYFPLTVTYANTQTYVGIHDDLTGLQGGAPGDYQHLTTAEKISILGKASLSDITFANLIGVYSDNPSLQAAIDGKQTELNGTGFVKINGNQSTIYYDNTTYLSTISGIVAGGELTGTYPNPALSNAAVISKVLTGWNGSATYTAITSSDTILSGMEKLNARISAIIASPGGVSSIAGGTNAPSVLNVAASSSTGNVTFSVDFDTQNQNLFLASPNGSSGAPSFRAIAVNDLPNSGATAGTYGSAALIPQIIVDAKGRITSISNITANAGGLVTAVSLTGPGIFNAYGSTGGSTPQLSFGLTNQTANTVWAGPASGANAAPQFRALVEDDIPTLSTTKIGGLNDLLANKLDNALNDGEIWIGNSTNAPQMRSLSQDIEITLTGVATIQPNVVDFSKIQEITGYDSITGQPGNLLGRWAAGTGNIQEVTLSGDFILDETTGVLSLSAPVTPILNTKGGLITYRQSIGQQVQLSAVFSGKLLMTDSAEDDGLKWVTAGGDIEVDSAYDGTFNITAGAVTLGKMAALPAYTVIGNETSGSLTPKALTKTELTTLVEQFTSSTPGVVPLSGGGTTNFLRADGSWAAPSGSGVINSAAQYSIPYYSDSPTGIALSGLGPQTTNGVYFLRANVTASAAVAPDWIGSTGSGNVVLATSPTLVTPNIGAATATSVNGLTITATTGTLTLASGSILATAGAFSTTLTATGATNVTLPTTGTLATLAGIETLSNKTLLSPQIGDSATNGHAHFRKAGAAIPSGFSNYATMWFPETGGNKRMSIMWDNLGYASEFQLDATASQTYTFPNATGTVALIDASNVLNVPKSGSTSGAIALGGGTSGTITLQAPATITGAGTYTMPAAYPAAASGYYLTSNTSGVLSWVLVTGGGDVTGPSSSTDGNFAVFNSTTGKIIMESSVASLGASPSGRATFNNGVDVGVSNTTTGTIVFRSSANAFTTTFQQGTSTQNLSYTWPTGPLTAGYILSTDISGNLSWTAAGAGDMILASTQTNTGAKTFNNNTLLLRNTGNTFSTTLVAGASTAARTITLPDATVTLAGLSLAQTFSAAQTFTGGATISTTALSVQSAATFSSSGTITSTVTGAATTPQIYINGATMNHLRISETGLAVPVTGSIISTGTKILLRAATTASQIPISIGLDTSNNLWIAGGVNATQTNNSIGFYMPISTTATSVGRFAATSSGAYGLVLDQISGGVLELGQVSTASATFIDFRGFPTGTIVPNGAGYTLGSGTRIVLYKPGTGYSTTIGYHNSGGIFLGVPAGNRLSLYADNIENFRVTASNNTSTNASISLANVAGTLSQVVQSRETGYVAFTGTTNKNTSYATGTVTLIQLAERVAAIQASLTTHGLIGT